MATLNDFVLRFYDADGNPADFSPAQTAQLIKLQSNLVDGQVIGSRELFDHIVTKIMGVVQGESVYHVSVDKLVSAHTDVTQRAINPSNVSKVLCGDYGILKGHPLYHPLLVGKGEDGRIYLDGGRHRLAAIVSTLKAFNFPDEWISTVMVPCFVMNHDVTNVIHNNTSRGMTTYELVGIKVSSKLPNLDISNPREIWAAYLEGNLDGTPVTQRSNAMRLTFIANTEESLSVLTADTRGRIASGLPNAFGKAFPDQKYALKDPEFLTKLMGFAAKVLPEVIEKHLESGITNLAVAASSLTNGVIMRLKKAVKEGSIKIPAKPQAVVKVTAEAEVKPKTTTTRRARSKKVTAKEAEAEAVAS